MGGKGSGKRGQELVKTAVRVGNQTERQSLPSRGLGFGQATELLATGGIGARIPRIQKALESTRYGNAIGRQQLESSLAGSGLLGTPYGIAALNQADITSGLAESGVELAEGDKALAQIAQALNLGPVVAAPFAGGTSAAINPGGGGTDNSGLYAGLGALLGSVAGNVNYGEGGFSYGAG